MKLSKRDKNLLFFTAIILTVFLIYSFVLNPIAEKNAVNKKKIRQKQIEIAELKYMQSDFNFLKEKQLSSKDRYSKRDANFTLFAFLDNLAGRTGIKPYISYMKPSSFVDNKTKARISSVEMKVKNITMKKLFKYLYMIETSDNIISITKFSVTKKRRTDIKISAIIETQAILF